MLGRKQIGASLVEWIVVVVVVVAVLGAAAAGIASAADSQAQGVEDWLETL